MDGWTAAHYAAHYGQAAALQFLHEAPLLSCSASSTSAVPVREAGANLNMTDNRGATPALLAAAQGKAEALEALAKARAVALQSLATS